MIARLILLALGLLAGLQLATQVFAWTYRYDAVLGPGEDVDADALLGLYPYLVGEPDSSDVEEWIYDEQRSGPLAGAAAMLADPEDPEAFDPAFTP